MEKIIIIIKANIAQTKLEKKKKIMACKKKKIGTLNVTFCMTLKCYNHNVKL